ncbi:succinate dehydrogenase [Brenneria goodwinii]|uniref:succinate dehydrogenase n=1 Tax=Brenneria goodwinii TaxID=1109412 RepID=UPI000F0F4B4E|nr:succinate dehydrogenase [Brenneria goodwinii]RLM21178.1 succinate dehydrogenase [Brenneria goodwinii]
MERFLFILQRFTTLLLIPFVFIHLGVMIYAVHHGLSAAAILGRTQGSWGWILFYSAFVVCAALHNLAGVRSVLIEWAGLSYRRAGWFSLSFSLLLLLLGIRAVIAVGGVPT